MNVVVSLIRIGVRVAVGEVGVRWFRVICGIYCRQQTLLCRGDIDVKSEERSQACGQMLSA